MKVIGMTAGVVCLVLLAAGCGGGEEQEAVNGTATAEQSPTAVTGASLLPGSVAVGRDMIQALQTFARMEDIGYREFLEAFDTMDGVCSAIQRAKQEGGGSGGGSWGEIDPSMSPFCDNWEVVKDLPRPDAYAEALKLAHEIEEFIGEPSSPTAEVASPIPGTDIPELTLATATCAGSTWGLTEENQTDWLMAADDAAMALPQDEWEATIKQRMQTFDNWEGNLTIVGDWLLERVPEAQQISDLMQGFIDKGPPHAECLANALTGQSVQPSPPEDRAGLEALLRSATPGLEQLPSGFALESEKFETNEEDAADRTELDPTLEDLETWGRLLGYEANYRRDSGTSRYVMLRLAVDVYKTAEGAAKAFNAESAVPESDEFKAGLQQALGATSVEIERISFPSLGEDSNAYRAVVVVPQSGSGSLQMAGYAVGALQGYLTANMEAWPAADSPPSMDELEGIAQAFDARMKDALE